MNNICKNLILLFSLIGAQVQHIQAMPDISFIEKDYDPQLLSDVQFLLSSEKEIDYDSARLKEIFKKYNYALFRVYKEFIAFEQGEKTSGFLFRTKETLDDLYKSLGYKYSYLDEQRLTKEKILARFFDLMVNEAIAEEIENLIPGEREKNLEIGYKFIKIPLWLTLKYPEIVNHAKRDFNLVVNAKAKVTNIEDFDEFLLSLSKVIGNYNLPKYGYRRSDSYLMTKYFTERISFNPGSYIKQEFPNSICARVPINERFKKLENWSDEKSNRVYFEKLMYYYEKMAIELRHYYESNYNLQEYANLADDILSHYICESAGDGKHLNYYEHILR